MGDRMATIRLRWLSIDIDQRGNVRRYVRRPGKAKVRIHAKAGTEEFFREYAKALATDKPPARKKVQAAIGSLRALAEAYMASAAFTRLDISTKTWRRRALNDICLKHGHKPVSAMTPRRVREVRDERADKPAAANQRLKALKAMFKWAVEATPLQSNPAHEVHGVEYPTKGHHTWSMDEIGTYEARWPIGSVPRLALAILLYTACRREDATRLGPQHVRHGRLQYRQAKNEGRKPVDVDVPLHPTLARIIEATPSGHLTFLVSRSGKPFSVAGFGMRMRDWCDAGGLPNCSAHGLRKAAATMLAEAGATPHQIMALTGHQTLEEVERYTRAARMRGLGDGAVALLRPDTTVPLSDPEISTGTKRAKKGR